MKKKVVAFFIDKKLGVSLALWAIKKRSQDDYLILCKKESRKHFEKSQVKFVGNAEQAYALNPDLIFSINYWRIIEKEFTQKFKIINLHHSYNLKYRGRHTCSWAIINARKNNNWTHGTTLHKIDEKIDCGEIICTYSCPIHNKDTAYSLFQRVEKLAKKMFRENYLKILEGDYQAKKLPPSKFYYRERDLSHFIDINLPPIEIFDRIRALTFPGKPSPYTVFDNHKIDLIWKGSITSSINTEYDCEKNKK